MHLKSNDANIAAFEFAQLLKLCAKTKDLQKGTAIHDEVATRGLLNHNVFIVSAVISMYAKCGAFDEAQQLLDACPVANEVSWNGLIAAYAQQGHGDEALLCYDRMIAQGYLPNAFTFSCVLKSCSGLKCLDKGQEIHVQVLRNGWLETDIVLASSLIDMYIKCGALEKAQWLFDELPCQDRVLWTALITGYSDCGLGAEAIRLYDQMQFHSFVPDAVTLLCILKACASIQAQDKGEEIHAQIMTMHLLQKHLRLGTALVDMYAKCGSLEKAQEVFDEIVTRDTILWNAMIAGCAQFEWAEDALALFWQMQLEGSCPTSVTFACVLKACGTLKDQDKGQKIYAQIVKDRLQEDVVVGNALIDMYAKCGELLKAREVFDKLPHHDSISWTILISGYTQHGHSEEAICCFEHMQGQGFSSDAAILSCILKACGNMGAMKKGEEIYAQIVKEQILEKETVVGNALLCMYAKSSALQKAQEVFDGLPMRNLVSWNTIITLYAEHGYWEEVMLLFKQMERGCFSPDTITFVCLLKACGCAGAAYTGQELHVKISNFGFLDNNMIGNALVAMYSNCGMLLEAHDLFDNLYFKDIALWSTLMSGYSQAGQDDVVFRLLENLIGANIEPNPIIFTTLFNTCSHGGLMDMGQMYLELIHKGYGIVPTIEHYSCIVDLLCRVCHLKKAVLVVEEMPLFPDVSTWHTVLGACQKLVRLKLGKWAFEHAVELDNMNAATYVSMRNIFVAAVNQKEAVMVEAKQSKRVVRMQKTSSPGNNYCYPAEPYHLHDYNDNMESTRFCFWPSDNTCLQALNYLVGSYGYNVEKVLPGKYRNISTINCTHSEFFRHLTLKSRAFLGHLNILIGFTVFTNATNSSQRLNSLLGFLWCILHLTKFLVVLKTLLMWNLVFSYQQFFAIILRCANLEPDFLQ